MRTVFARLSIIGLTLLALPAFAGETIVGIGIAISRENSKLVVHDVFVGSPADQGGVHSGDIITAVDNHLLKGKSLKQIVKVIRGPVDSQVRLTLSDKAGHLRDALMIREKFEVPDHDPDPSN